MLPGVGCMLSSDNENSCMSLRTPYHHTSSGVTQRVHVGIWDILGPYSRYMGTPLGPKYIPYSYMDPLGKGSEADARFFSDQLYLVC